MSIRTKLTLTYTTVLVVVFAGVGIAIDLLYGQMLSARLDDALKEDIEEIEQSIQVQPDGSVVVPAQVVEAPDLQRRRVRIASPEGKVFREDPLLARVQPTEMPKYAYGSFEGLRIGGTLCHREGHVYVIHAARLEPGAETARMGTTLALAFLGTLIVSAFGAWFLVGRTLRPVDEMARAARKISAESRDARVPVANPHDELGRLAETLNEMLARISRSIEQMRRFTADASHELRTPLTAIKTVGEVALRGERSSEEYRDTIGSMLEEIDRLSRLVDELLFLARADAGAIKVDKKEVPLDRLVGEVTDQLLVLAQERGITMERTGLSTKALFCDAEKVRRAVVNLLDNAIKFTPAGGKVTVGGAVDGTGARIWIEDTGAGIPRERLERIFERFYRLDRDRSTGGSGLGLAIARWCIEVQGGRIIAESEPGRGSKFTILLGA